MKRALLLLAGTLAATPVFAENLYVTAALGFAEQKITVDDLSLSENDAGFTAALGYRFNRHFAIEAGAATFGTMSVRAMDARFSSKPTSLYAAAVATFPVTATISVSGKLGVARSRTSLSASDGTDSESVRNRDTSALVGIGAEMALSPAVSLVAEYQHFGNVAKEEGATIKASMASFGVRYSF